MEFVVVVPCYNEAARWRADYWASLMAMHDVHWVFVDDGSTDGTRELVAQTSELGSGEVLCLPRNQGKAEAVRLGLNHALKLSPDSAVGIGFVDADGAFSENEIRRLKDLFRLQVDDKNDIEAIWTARVALAGRAIKRSRHRHYIGRAVATFVSLNDLTIPYDTQSGLKLFVPSETLSLALSTPFETRWLFELEILTRWRSLTNRAMSIWEEPLLAWNDVPGSRVTGGEAVRVLRELIVLKRQQNRSRSPAADRRRRRG